MGLRLSEGIDPTRFAALAGRPSGWGRFGAAGGNRHDQPDGEPGRGNSRWTSGAERDPAGAVGMIRGIWATVGLMCVVLGVVGLFLPFLPTVPFLLAAGFFFGKSSRRLHRWLLNHPVLGPPVPRLEHPRCDFGKRQATGDPVGGRRAGYVSCDGIFNESRCRSDCCADRGVMVFVWTRPSS